MPLSATGNVSIELLFVLEETLKRFHQFRGKHARFFGQVLCADPIVSGDGFVSLFQETVYLLGQVFLRRVELLPVGQLQILLSAFMMFLVVLRLIESRSLAESCGEICGGAGLAGDGSAVLPPALGGAEPAVSCRAREARPERALLARAPPWC